MEAGIHNRRRDSHVIDGDEQDSNWLCSPRGQGVRDALPQRPVRGQGLDTSVQGSGFRIKGLSV
jgi:hypothetical protein